MAIIPQAILQARLSVQQQPGIFKKRLLMYTYILGLNRKETIVEEKATWEPVNGSP